ncbi:MAG TPA: hypothetical protein VMZ69_11700 [Saprospiraceae bacterium]|nr:hypothetical protein [Saprospiraceae bacterium]
MGATMKKSSLPFLLLLLASNVILAQQNFPSKLKVFIDCSSTWCDLQHIKSEINVVDFLYDNAAADVHVLITNQNTGSGGYEYHLIFFGKQSFKSQTDTLRFYTDPNATEFEIRDLLLRYIKTGLVPYIAKTSSVKNIEITLKSANVEADDVNATKDSWNAWVFTIGASGNINADANYNDKSYNANMSVSKVTEKLKTGLYLYQSKNKSIYEFEENDSIKTFVVNNHEWSVDQYLVKSITSHWSAGLELKYSQNTFSNNKGRAYLHVATEYNVFPYKEVNNKLFTISYGLTARRNTYYDTTIYNKTTETLYGHRASAYLSLNQKWGTTSAGVTYHNYFSNWNLFNLGADIYTSVRIAGGLSFYISAFGGLTRDQIFLVKGNATPEEVLARRRQLASGYNYYLSFGLNYRFGSKINNVVNPRFDRSWSQFDN